ncbi:MAG: Glycosyl transferases group 1 [Tenericutes bacterium ADurb.BinA124]|nr:MAG: Glycosyl transferases group 1 [Tenericutes bacterium ADurb.BinA124]
MNYLIIGGLNIRPFDECDINYSDVQIANQEANSKLMWNLINGLEANGGIVTILNTPNLLSYQENKEILFHKGYYWKHRENISDYSISFLNFFPFSIFSRKTAINRQCKKWIKKTEGEKTIIGVTPHYPIVYAINKYSSKAKTCLVVPDLPEYTGKSRRKSLIYRLLKKIDVSLFYRNIRRIKNFVVLTKYMEEKLGKNNYVCIESMVDPSDVFNEIHSEASNEFSFLYSGTIHDNYGVIEFAETIIEYDINCKFYICGLGTGVERVAELSRADSRIIYLGALNPLDVRKYQSIASVLVNPRPNDGSDYLKYSFPSKTMEYMLSGKPVICFKLPGIPDEYDDYLYYMESFDKKSMMKAIKHHMELSESELDSIGRANRTFVLNNKNNVVQTKKIIEMLGN